MQILLADDDANTINLVSKYLINWRYEVVIARNGLEAIDIIEGSNPPPLIVLDWLMPVMDGIEVIKQVRKKELSTPPYIILFTIRDEKQAIIEGLDAGANDYVTKPFDKDEFHARIRVGERFVELQNTLAQRIFELQEAMVQINTLRGILPICSFCHKIRNDQESWERIEKYITDHSEARFSHGICPECAEKHYPQFLKKT